MLQEKILESKQTNSRPNLKEVPSSKKPNKKKNNINKLSKSSNNKLSADKSQNPKQDPNKEKFPNEMSPKEKSDTPSNNQLSKKTEDNYHPMPKSKNATDKAKACQISSTKTMMKKVLCLNPESKKTNKTNKIEAPQESQPLSKRSKAMLWLVFYIGKVKINHPLIKRLAVDRMWVEAMKEWTREDSIKINLR